MQFQADANKIKRWREERHWSQEHLADLAGIGLRTVQRIERGDKASGESLKALAAAFNVDVMALTLDAKTEAEALVRQKQAKVTAGMRLAFFIHLGSYLFGMLLFASISLGIGGDHYVMLWPTIWWTVGFAGHALTVAIVELTYRYEREVGMGK
ncbi:MAG: helix-turn-helix domain-containing protein [Alphaproteobacteria bacterium]|nr:XRE family transcriptional regulator [Hyphomonas sp.]MBR9807195.1 helix-turn-helix domain-containing protein [Alphaproteobacteria bacterium]|tara:strand:+ start:385 stop:846 length:462 start_codon:yes stop_codon:yes gene_type:complete